MLAKELEDYEFSKGYLLAQIEEHGKTIQDALIAAIEATGLTAFAEKNDFHIQSVFDFVLPCENSSS